MMPVREDVPHSLLAPPNNSMEPFRFALGIFDRPGQPGVAFGAILALAGQAAHPEAVGRGGQHTLPYAVLLCSMEIVNDDPC
jgi:hypothetical protein